MPKLLSAKYAYGLWTLCAFNLVQAQYHRAA